jgi:NAD-dependent SIR2 family protein deacetylase
VHESTYQRCAALIESANSLIITAGAGMGVDSGLPDFRGAEGFWRAYPSLAAARIGFEDIANPRAFRGQPRRAWGFYGHRLDLYRNTVPHTGFQILREIATHLTHGAFIFTSNVDGQFQKAGFDAGRIYECHGSIHHLQCVEGCKGEIWSAEGFEPQVNVARCQLISSLPVCPHCGDTARPNVLMFYDGEWFDHRVAEQGKRLNAWLDTVNQPVIIELGAGTHIPTVRRFSEDCGLPLIRINPTEPQVPSRSSALGLRLGALDALRGIHAALQERGFMPGDLNQRA